LWRSRDLLPVHGSQSGISQGSAAQGAFEERPKVPLLAEIFADGSQYFIWKDFDVCHG
jgi:hypothetical protein